MNDYHKYVAYCHKMDVEPMHVVDAWLAHWRDIEHEDMVRQLNQKEGT